jgi:NADH:ubiquinone oxidoreductase subunit F (NADH-binding)
MKKDNILSKVKKAALVGRGGGGFPVHLKWQRIKDYQADKKILVCNVSEGEPGVKKDFHILKNNPEKVFKGMRITLDFLDSDTAYFNFNKIYYDKLKNKIDPLVKKYAEQAYNFKIFIEEPSYIGGESGSLLNAIEGKRTEPRLKPPSPSLRGIHGNPCLVHNVETLYNVCLVAEGKFTDKRYYTISKQVPNPGVYFLPADLTIEEVLKTTKNYPDFDFFVQAGGGASGHVYNQEQIKTTKTPGSGSIEVYPTTKPAKEMLLQWFEFYKDESCGKCIPCRCGTYNLYQITKDRQKVPWKEILKIVESLHKTAFCALGRSLYTPVTEYYVNVLNKKLPKGLNE